MKLIPLLLIGIVMTGATTFAKDDKKNDSTTKSLADFYYSTISKPKRERIDDVTKKSFDLFDENGKKMATIVDMNAGLVGNSPGASAHYLERLGKKYFLSMKVDENVQRLPITAAVVGGKVLVRFDESDPDSLSVSGINVIEGKSRPSVPRVIKSLQALETFERFCNYPGSTFPDIAKAIEDTASFATPAEKTELAEMQTRWKDPKSCNAGGSMNPTAATAQGSKASVK